MKKRTEFAWLRLALAGLALNILVVSGWAASLPPSLFFVANEGQWEGAFAFKCHVDNASYFVTPSGMTIDLRSYLPPLAGGQRGAYSTIRGHGRPCPYEDVAGHVETRAAASLVRGHVLRMSFVSANPSPEIIGEEKLASYSNYFLGRDSCKWRSRVGHYAKVIAKNVWAGIDVEYQVQDEGVETIYHAKPGADYSQIVIQYEGLDAPLTIGSNSSLHLQTSLGIVEEKAPFAYQIVNGRQIEVPTRYELLGDGKYTLRCEGVDASRELVIDPLLCGTYLGGLGPDESADVAIDGSGRKVVTGWTETSDFPVTPGAYCTHFFTSDGFVSKFSVDGDSLIFSTFMGTRTPGGSSLYAVSIDPSGRVYVGGQSDSPHWPLTADAFDTVNENDWGEGVFARLSPDGTMLEFSSFIGGSGTDGVMDLAIDALGRVYLCGVTQGRGFPITADAMYPESGGGGAGFVSVFDPVSSTLVYSTFIPSNGETDVRRMAILSPGYLWVSGATGSTNLPVTPDAVQLEPGSTTLQWDGFVLLLDLNINRVAYGSYLGGRAEDQAFGLSALGDSAVVLAGYTLSADFPVTPSAYDTSLPVLPYAVSVFVSKISRVNGLVASTFLGGGSAGEAVLADTGHITVVGYTYSDRFPVTSGAFDTVFNGNGLPSTMGDCFITRFNSDLSRIEYATYIGGSGDEICTGMTIQGPDTMWIVGQTGSGDFPVTPGAFQTTNHGGGDAFLVGFALPPDSVSAIRPSAEMLPRSFSLTAYPNPFNPSTTIVYALPKSSQVQMRLYDILGRVAFSTELGRMSAGQHSYRLDGSGMASGVYFVNIKFDNSVRTKPIYLVK